MHSWCGSAPAVLLTLVIVTTAGASTAVPFVARYKSFVRKQCSVKQRTKIESLVTRCGSCVLGGDCPLGCCGAADTTNQGLVCSTYWFHGVRCNCARIIGLASPNGRAYSTDGVGLATPKKKPDSNIQGYTCTLSLNITQCPDECAFTTGCNGSDIDCANVGLRLPNFDTGFIASGKCDTRGSAASHCSTDSKTSMDTKSTGSSPSAALIGGTVGGAVVALVLLSVASVLLWRRCASSKHQTSSDSTSSPPHESPEPDLPAPDRAPASESTPAVSPPALPSIAVSHYPGPSSETSGAGCGGDDFETAPSFPTELVVEHMSTASASTDYTPPPHEVNDVLRRKGETVASSYVTPYDLACFEVPHLSVREGGR
jgi:hypothetical protein